MAFERIRIHNQNLDDGVRRIEANSDICETEKKDLMEFIRLGKLGKINKRKKHTDSRCMKYLDILRIPLAYFKKDCTEITIEEMEKFDECLSNDEIRNKRTGKTLAQNTKVEIRKLFKVYLRWKLREDPLKYQKLTDWLDTTYKSKTPEYLSEEEIISLLDGCKNDTERFIVCVLFDSGARIEEFINIRWEDVTEPTTDFPYYMFDFKEEYSKTKGRKIGMYWLKSETVIRKYLKGLKSTKKDEQLFSGSYDNTRKFLKRLGWRVLNRNVHPHLFRHASATYYASRLNRQELCIRYAWSFTSSMPDLYIARAGLDQRKIMETFKSEGMQKFREENDELKTQMIELHSKLKLLEVFKEKSVEQISQIYEELKELKQLQIMQKELINNS